MRYHHPRITSPLLLAGLLAVAGAAHAQSAPAAEVKAPEPDQTFSFNAGLTSDYRYRGISQSRLNPAVSVGADFSHKSGFYVGTWISSIRWIKDAGGGANAEWDLYGGYKGALGEVGYDVGLLRYQYPGHDLAISPNTTEVYGALTYGVATLKYSHALSNLFGFADSRGSGYLDLSATFDLGQGWSVVPHLGYQRVRHQGDCSYTDLAVTLNKDLGHGWVASAALLGTDAKRALYVTPGGRFTGRSALVVGLKYNF